ncbi:MAG: hypothetical protein Q8K30_05245 [Candidatus Gracilibacteria bacterium]|nr:hypothetical protein [Candidatus Gracilibacteria bacterium]
MDFKQLMEFAVNTTITDFFLVKNQAEIFIESNVKNKAKREKFLNELEGITMDQGIYYRGTLGGNDSKVIENNRIAQKKGQERGSEELTRLLLKIKQFLNSDLNMEEKESKKLFSGFTNVKAGGDIIIGDNNKNIINDIEKLLELINKSGLDKKSEIIALLDEFKKSNDKNKLVDIFSILGNGASISSLIVALSGLVN